jgi:hypothetical protein
MRINNVNTAAKDVLNLERFTHDDVSVDSHEDSYPVASRLRKTEDRPSEDIVYQSYVVESLYKMLAGLIVVVVNLWIEIVNH